MTGFTRPLRDSQYDFAEPFRVGQPDLRGRRVLEVEDRVEDRVDDRADDRDERAVGQQGQELGDLGPVGEVAADQAALALVAGWGLAFGGTVTLFVTAGMRAGGTDAIQSIIVTTFNISIAAGGVLGGLLLSGLGVKSIPWITFAMMIPTVITTIAGRRHAFPPWPRG
ncbi:MAG: hypothetical protein ACRDN0_23385 [Trebonia sp.]